MARTSSRGVPGGDAAILALFAGDYRSRLHLREIARRLGANHQSVSRLLGGLEERGVLRSAIRGRNKEYRLADSILVRDALAVAETARKRALLERHFLFQKLLQELDLRAEPLLVFGSYATGEETAASDIDLLLVARAPRIARAVREFAQRHGKAIHLLSAAPERFSQGLSAGDRLLLEVRAKHVILNNPAFFIDAFWRSHGPA